MINFLLVKQFSVIDWLSVLCALSPHSPFQAKTPCAPLWCNMWCNIGVFQGPSTHSKACNVHSYTQRQHPKWSFPGHVPNPLAATGYPPLGPKCPLLGLQPPLLLLHPPPVISAKTLKCEVTVGTNGKATSLGCCAAPRGGDFQPPLGPPVVQHWHVPRPQHAFQGL